MIERRIDRIVETSTREPAMQLSELSAQQLALIDSVCLQFENAFRSGNPITVEQALESYRVQLNTDESTRTPDPEHLELLRRELNAVVSELTESTAQSTAQSHGRSAGAGMPFQPKPGLQAAEQRPQSSAAEHPASGKNAAANANADQETQWGPRQLTDSAPADELAPQGDPTRQSGPARESEPLGNDRSVDPTPHFATGGQFTPGQMVGPYRMEEVLAHGGMGVVYRASDTRLDRVVAIKMLGFPHLSLNDPKRRELVERFEREAKAVAALSHPNIVELFDVGVVGDVPYAVMEFLGGVTLANLFQSGPMPVEQTRQLGLQIAGALATAHAAGVVHRDLKPQNVIVADSSGADDRAAFRVKLVDFGLSRVSDSFLGTNDGDSGKTRSGMILGTPGYMAPEQARGESATGAADLFGLGCVLYEAFFGKPAIPGDTPADRLAGTLNGNVSYEATGCEKSSALCELIAECLHKDPDQRPLASDVYARLRQFDLGTASSINLARSGSASSGSVSSGSALFGDAHAAGDFSASLGGASHPLWLRRQALTAIAGGLLGGLSGAFSIGGRGANQLDGIHSLAVLTLQPASDERDEPTVQSVAQGMPLEANPISDGDILASALVNELTGVDGLAVLPYRPLTASVPEDFARLGSDLGVDAFLTGTYGSSLIDEENYWVLNWQLISGRDGRVLAGDQFLTKPSGTGNPLLGRTEVASVVAETIGRFLVTSGQTDQPPNSDSYCCMAKGHAYADADSAMGLRQAIKCFDKAHEEDPRRSEPLGARAVAALTLAARSDRAEALANLEVATESMIEALKIDPQSVLGRLAKAMLEWQAFHHYSDANRLLETLERDHEYNWQIQHQRGLLLAALGKGDLAVDALRMASKLNPMSMLVKTDRCRVDWFFNDEPRAVGDARRYLDSVEENNPARWMIVGLLIDIYESRGDFEHASRLQLWDDVPTQREAYFQRRLQSLEQFPYGPFGSELNGAILTLRSTPDADAQILGQLDESGAMMFPLLLARHPAFFELRAKPGAMDFLPPDTVDGRWS